MDFTTIFFGFVTAVGWILIASFPMYVLTRRAAIVRRGETSDAARAPVWHGFVIAALMVLGIILASVGMAFLP